MIPLMLEKGFRANGWLGMLLGVRPSHRNQAVLDLVLLRSAD